MYENMIKRENNKLAEMLKIKNKIIDKSDKILADIYLINELISSNKELIKN